MARRKSAASETMSVDDMLTALSEKLEQQAANPNIYDYDPTEKQDLFHRSQDHLRVYIGGNRSGKTFSAVAEDIMWAGKIHPHHKMPRGKVRGRVVAADLEHGVKQIIIPIFKILMPPDMMINGNWEDSYSEGSHLLTFKNGSTIEFMSYEQDTVKFAGTSRHFIHYDEEPPKHIFTECEARLVDTNGYSWISMTPIEGATWVFEDIYEPTKEALDRENLNVEKVSSEIGPAFRSETENTTIIEVGMNENKHITEEARNRYLDKLGDDERAARSKGTFVTVGGLVFKNFQASTHLTDCSVEPRKWQEDGAQIYTSVDHGWANPTAWYWHVVFSDGRVITFSEHYESEMTIEEHARIVNLREQEWGLNQEDIIRTGDPAMKQTSGISGTSIITEYAKHGIYIYVDSIPVDRGIGIARMQQYFKLRPVAGSNVEHPMWMIHKACPNLAKELRKLRWKMYTSKKMRENNNRQEQVHKKDDHGFDSCKYFATFLDELAPDQKTPDVNGIPQSNGILMYDEALRRLAEERQATQWTTLETYS